MLEGLVLFDGSFLGSASKLEMTSTSAFIFPTMRVIRKLICIKNTCVRLCWWFNLGSVKPLKRFSSCHFMKALSVPQKMLENFWMLRNSLESSFVHMAVLSMTRDEKCWTVDKWWNSFSYWTVFVVWLPVSHQSAGKDDWKFFNRSPVNHLKATVFFRTINFTTICGCNCFERLVVVHTVICVFLFISRMSTEIHSFLFRSVCAKNRRHFSKK